MQRLHDQQTGLLAKMARQKHSVRALRQGRPRLRSVLSSSPRMNSMLPCGRRSWTQFVCATMVC